MATRKPDPAEKAESPQVTEGNTEAKLAEAEKAEAGKSEADMNHDELVEHLRRQVEIANLRSELARIKAGPAPVSPEGESVFQAPHADHPYDEPGHEGYKHTLVLATGELVGHANGVSTHHHSRLLDRDVPVTAAFEN